MFRRFKIDLSKYDDARLYRAQRCARLDGEFSRALFFLCEYAKRKGFDSVKEAPPTRALYDPDLTKRVHIAIRETRVPVREHKPIRGMQDAADVLLDHRVGNHVLMQTLRVSRHYAATLRMRYRNGRKQR